MSASAPNQPGAAEGIQRQDYNVHRLLNWLRAAVLGANDGIVSIAGLVMGVAGATHDSRTILLAGLAGMVAGALSMAVGEYVSVSTQRDTERSLLTQVREDLRDDSAAELAKLAQIYRGKGLSEATAWKVAAELHEHDAYAAHAEAELGLEPYELTNPWEAVIASFVAFTLGAALPLATITLAPVEYRLVATVVATVVALTVTGYSSAKLVNASWRRAIARTVIGGLLAMLITYWIGELAGHLWG